MTTATVRTLDDAVVADLEAIMNEPGSVLTNISSRTNRARVPAPFPVHRWGEYACRSGFATNGATGVGDREAGQPRGHTGGAASGGHRTQRRRCPAARRDHRRRQADERDQGGRPGRPLRYRRTRHQHDEAERGTEQIRCVSPGYAASYPCSLVGGRIACSGFSLLGTRFGTPAIW
jgi:hypothetical protein